MFSPSAIHGQGFQKVALIFLFSLLSVALIITWNTPATGYEASIYRSTPLLLWVSLISSVIAGITLVAVSIAKNELDQSYFWKIGFLLVFLSYTVCLALFIIRGYYMWCISGDPASHIGWIREMLNTGHTASTSLIYPITHVYLSEIILITDLDLVFLHKIIPVIFSILFILYMYVFAETVFHNTAAALLVGIVSCTIFRTDFYLNLIPSGLSSLFLPLVLFVIFKCMYQRRFAWAVPRSILVILYPVFHPVSTMFIGLVLLTLWIPHTIPRIARYIHERKKTLSDLENYKFGLMPPFLTLLIWFIFWISAFKIWDTTIKKIYQAIFGEGVPSEAMELMNSVSYAQEYGYSVTEIVIKQYGVLMILSALSILAVLLLLKNLHHGRYNESLLSLVGPFGALSIFIPVLLLFDLPFNAFRFLHALTILMVILSAYTLYTILIYKRGTSLLRGTTFAAVFVAMIISGLFLGSMLNLYPSPYNFYVSYQNTHLEVTGMEYVYHHRNVTIPLTRITIDFRTFSNAILTPEERTLQHISRYSEDKDLVPWHFGYDTNSSLSLAYDKETDLVIIQKDRLLYTDNFPDMAKYRFTKQDFKQLEIDPGVDALYSNGEFDFFKINVMF